MKNKILMFLLLLPYIKPEYISTQFQTIDRILDLAWAISLCIIICLYIREIVKKNKISKIMLAMLSYEGILILSTFINKGDLHSLISEVVTTLGICIAIEYFIMISPKETIDSILFILKIWIYINFITVLLFPKGMYVTELQSDNFFLGYDNTHIKYILPAICLALISSYYKSDKVDIRTIFLITISVLTVFIRKSATSMIGLSIILLYLLIPALKNSKVFNFRNFFITYIVMFILIVIFRVQDNFSYLVETVLHKSLTFTGRTEIWDAFIKLIKEKMILGYGVLSGTQKSNLTGIFYGVATHDKVLDVMFSGGAILLINYFVINILIGKKLMKNKESEFSKILSITWFAFFIMMITETLNHNLITMLIILSYHVDDIIKEYNLKKNGETNAKN